MGALVTSATEKSPTKLRASASPITPVLSTINTELFGEDAWDMSRGEDIDLL